MRDTIQKAQQMRNSSLYERRDLLFKKLEHVLKHALADLIPRTETAAGTHQSPHQRIHDQPPCENDDEPNRNIREVQPPRPREEYGREEHCDVDARVEDVLCDRCEIAHRFAPTDAFIATLRNDLPGERIGRERERRRNKENYGEEYRYVNHLPAYHGDSLPRENSCAPGRTRTCGARRHDVYSVA